jgi:hypothetical protein
LYDFDAGQPGELLHAHLAVKRIAPYRREVRLGDEYSATL